MIKKLMVLCLALAGSACAEQTPPSSPAPEVRVLVPSTTTLNIATALPGEGWTFAVVKIDAESSGGLRDAGALANEATGAVIVLVQLDPSSRTAAQEAQVQADMIAMSNRNTEVSALLPQQDPSQATFLTMRAKTEGIFTVRMLGKNADQPVAIYGTWPDSVAGQSRAIYWSTVKTTVVQ